MSLADNKEEYFRLKEKYQALEESHAKLSERFQTLLDSLNVGYLLTAVDEEILEVNETALRMTGFKREEIVGHNTREYMTEQEFQKMRDLESPLQEDTDINAYQLEWRLNTASGERIPIVMSTLINRDAAGRVESSHVVMTDISEQKKIQSELEQANRKLESILFGIEDSVVVFGLDGSALLANPRSRQIYGTPPTPFSSPESDSEEPLILDIDGRQRHFLARIFEIRDQEGTAFAFVEILKDMTDRIELQEQKQELLRIKREMKHEALTNEMIGTSPVMSKVFDLIVRCSEVDSTILITGETGAGKELAARAIHSESTRKDKPFVAINCGALPDTLLESELFGHVKGAFTGAISDRPGLFREADGGTLFLDEVGDLSAPLQMKLLRALQEREVRPVGGDRSFPVDIRVIAATNKDIKDLVDSHDFREDLYYRIAVIPLMIPPLRDRKEDILLLAEHLIKKHRRSPKRKKSKNRPIGFNQAAQKVLLSYSWPGNIRELENAVEHALAMTDGSLLSPADLPINVVTDQRRIALSQFPFNKERSEVSGPTQSAKEPESEAILKALLHHRWNRTLAAGELGISRTTLWKKMKIYGLS